MTAPVQKDALEQLAVRLEAYDPQQSMDNRADELALHQDIVMETGLGSLTVAFDATFVRSLDAAMTLVLEGVEGLALCFKVERFYLGNGIWKCRASAWDGLGRVSSLDTASDAAIPALALCAAALRARSLSLTSGETE